MVLETQGETGAPWTRLEIEAAVSAYFEMIEMARRGQPFTKAEVVRRLGSLLPARSKASIERKFQNISAVFREHGSDRWIEGYKPLQHYQRELETVVLARMKADRRVAEALATYETTALPASEGKALSTTDVLVPQPGTLPARTHRTSVILTGGPFAALRDFQRRELGTAGEEWVVDLEREQLRRSNRPDLADSVRWVARDDGDGAGYDIRSFHPDGEERLIEVKTTNLGPRTPFYITRWEVEVSRQRADNYSLYRVHGFARDPRIYVLEGSVEERARLKPKIYLGLPI